MKVTQGPLTSEKVTRESTRAVPTQVVRMKIGMVAAMVCLLLAALVSTPVSAAARAHAEALPRVASVQNLRLQPLATIRVQNKGISKNEATALVKRQFGGKILAISEVQRKGKSMYRVKGLSDKSQVYVVFVDKQSGRISR